MLSIIGLRNLFFVFIIVKCIGSARILGVFPMPGISHYILASKLMIGLAEAGHDVTMISPYALKELPKNGSYTDVVLDGFKEDFEAFLKNMNLFDDKRSVFERINAMSKTFLESANRTLFHPHVNQLIQSNKKFDAVIMEQFFNDAHKVFAHIYDCPLIILSSVGPNGFVNAAVGNPQPVSYVPHMMNPDFSNEFTFLFRAKNLMSFLLQWLMTNYLIFPNQDLIMHQAFPTAPSVYDLYTNVSLVLLNSHTSIYPSVPLVPNMVEIGGYFINPPKKLPEDLQNFLDSAKEGAIYFSMGSNLKSKDIPENTKKIILGVLGELKQKILWKFEEDLPGKPPNVMIKSWLPQQDVLAHPNIKLFITHGGLLSTTETIYHGVPILAIPVFADQPANAERAAADGYGLVLPYNDPNFTKERLRSMVNELLTNPKYRENVQRRSKVYHDRPQKPMENAVYWVEYVIRHKGAQHLRVASIRMPWYKYFMVDVIGTFILCVFITMYSVKLAFKKIYRKKFNNSTKKIKAN